MSRRVALVLTAATCTLVAAAACGGGADDERAETTSAPAAATTAAPETAEVAETTEGGADDTGAAPDEDAEAAAWDAVAVLAEDGDLVVHDRRGEPVDRLSTGLVGLNARVVAAAEGVVVLSDDEAGEAVVVDVADGELTRFAVPAGSVTRVVAPGVLWAVNPSGGADATVIDVSRGTSTEIIPPGDGEALFLPNAVVAADSAVAALEAGSTRTVIVPLDRPGEPVVVDGAPVTVRGDVVSVLAQDRASSQLVDYGLDGSRRGVIEVPGPVIAAAALRDGQVLAVNRDGVVFSVGDGEASQVGHVDVADGSTAPVVAHDQTRLALATADRVIVLDDRGEVVALHRDLPDVRPLQTSPAGRCLNFFSDGEVITIDAENGAIISTAEGSVVTLRSADGCTYVVDGTTLLHDGEQLDVGDQTIGALAPDGSAVVLVDGRVATLAQIDGRRLVIGAQLADEPAIPVFVER